MKTESKKNKILLMLIKGLTQSEIVTKLKGKKKSQKVLVSRYTKEFLNKNWIKCVDNQAYLKQYRATPTCALTQQKEKVNLLRSGRKIRVHNLCWKYKLIGEPKREVNWDKETKLKNGTIQKILYFPSFTISLFSNNNIYIWVKEQYIDDVDQWERLANETMLHAQAFLQKLLLCQLTLPEIARDPHFAKPIEDPVLMNILKRQGIMKFNDVWIDASKPGFEYGEIESTDINKLETMQKLQWTDLKIPERMDSVESMMDRMTITIGKMAESQLQILEQQTPQNIGGKDKNTDKYIY